ncbi:MAG: Nif3-like dinuclear metal center hexameric protein, partial [Crocinitomicaceae bacterium]
MKVADLCEFLESSFSLSLQEEYDNSGLLVGERDMKISNVLISLDLTEEIVLEAIRKNCNVIVSHHPIIFRGIKNLAQPNLVNRVLIACIRQHIAIYAIHT